jgi:hypothetical protein
MKQKKLVKQLYRACFDHDAEKINQLRKAEFKKIFRHKADGKTFDAKWCLVRI